MSGCRYSEALATIIDDPYGTYEPDAQPQYNDVAGAPENPDLVSSEQNDSENKAEQRPSLPVYRADAPENGFAKARTYDASSDNALEATEGDDPAESEEQAASVAESGEEQGAGAGDVGPQQESPEGSAEPNAVTGRGGEGRTYGEDGTYDELPDAAAIAATGTYATIAQMLGGAGAVAASSESWVADVAQRGLFPGEGVESVAVAWSGDGSVAGSLDVDAVLASSADVLLHDAATALSAADTESLEQAGVSVVEVPALGAAATTDADIVTAVRVVGQVLSSSKAACALSSSDMASAYAQMHDGALSACKNANGGYSYKMIAGKAAQSVYQPNLTGSFSDVRVTTAYVDAWTACATPVATADRSFGLASLYLDGQTMDISDGLGLSATVPKGSFALIDYYLQCSGVVNNAYDGERPVSADEGGSTLPYPVAAGRTDGLSNMRLGTRELPSALWYGMYGTTVYDVWSTLGDEDFPCLLARTDDIAQSIAESAAKVNGLYNTGKPYEVRVVPRGVFGSWADGTPESYLLAPWVYGVFQQEGDISEASAQADEFYSLFYRTDGAGALVNLEGTYRAACPTG